MCNEIFHSFWRKLHRLSLLAFDFAVRGHRKVWKIIESGVQGRQNIREPSSPSFSSVSQCVPFSSSVNNTMMCVWKSHECIQIAARMRQDEGNFWFTKASRERQNGKTLALPNLICKIYGRCLVPRASRKSSKRSVQNLNWLTVLFPKFLTLHTRWTVFPTNPVTFDETVVSK